MTIYNYLDNINQRYQLGNATEHTFRGDLQQLLETLVPEIRATNEPKRQSCGAPDYILTKKDIPVGFIEAKDIGDKDLEGKKKAGNKEQFDRYKASLNNLIFTDYIDFHLYIDGEFITKVAIAESSPNPSRVGEMQIVPKPENFKTFENLINDFCVHVGQTIKSPKKLAEMMAGKARLLSDVIGKALTSDQDHQEDSTLKEQMLAFREILIHDITPKGFADVYAQTIAYGMFAARLHDPSLDSFSRQEAAELIPKSNPFLRKLFGYIAGPDIDDRIKWIVDNLTEIFLACDVEDILKNYGKATKMEDPIIHFYETFLSEYDPKLRKSRGVWYTPAPVVNFIVRAVDDILKSEFNLPQGLADTSKTTIKVNTQIPDKNFKSGYKQFDQEVHKVQILDPATGTGTFLAEVVKHIHKKFKGQEGIWSHYVENELLPRLNGFELLMASYAMAHLQLDLLLKETGFKPTKGQRTRIYLTNSLEEYHPDTGTLFANWLSSEANEANRIKRDTPVMCIIGNPPYSVSSSNKSDWIEKLVFDYKKDLNERNIQPLSDDYIKFIRFGQYFIEKNGEGILAYISNNSFVDGIIHRQMRKNLTEVFDKVYILDLHGNSNKVETSLDGSKDENVFDIQQGVSINIFIKNNKGKKNQAVVFHKNLYGLRGKKYEYLNNTLLENIDWKELKVSAPNFFFTEKDFSDIEKYERGFTIDKLLPFYSTGIKTHRDDLVTDFKENELLSRINDFSDASFSDDEIRRRYFKGVGGKFLVGDNRDWKMSAARTSIKSYKHSEKIIPLLYRPFDNRYIYYTQEMIDFGREKIMQNIINGSTGLIVPKQVSPREQAGCIISNYVGVHKSFSAYNTNYYFPLYLYPETNEHQPIEQSEERKPNLNQEIVKEIANKLALTFTNEKETTANTFAPIDILDYIYAVLHSPTYREKYKEFLKIDFPRVPYPKDAATFWQFVKLGGGIRQIHLMESPKVGEYITTYPKGGSNQITTKVASKDWELFDKENQIGRIWINEEQYFDNIPLNAWEFYIGGYQPAQKWLKDRKERTLDYEDILHYQKIIVALYETDRLMKEIDEIEIE